MLRFVFLMLLAACVSTPQSKKSSNAPSQPNVALSPESEYRICKNYEKKASYDLAVACYERLSSADYPNAHLGLAKAYENGNGVRKNASRARRYYEKAANGGNTEAALKLAADSSSDDAEAFKWYKKAADNGNAKAAFALSHMYAAGKGTVKNEEQSKYWLTISAANGFAHSQYLMGRVEYNRYQISKDASALKKARDWLKKAADQGNSDAKTMLNSLPSS